MTDPRSQALDGTRTLQHAAERARQQAGDCAHAALLPSELGDLEQSLHQLGRGYDAAVGSLISPLGRPTERVRPRSRQGASTAQQAQLAAALQDTGAALRKAAESCGQARELLWKRMGAPDRRDDAPDGARSRAAA